MDKCLYAAVSLYIEKDGVSVMPRYCMMESPDTYDVMKKLLR